MLAASTRNPLSPDGEDQYTPGAAGNAVVLIEDEAAASTSNVDLKPTSAAFDVEEMDRIVALFRY